MAAVSAQMLDDLYKKITDETDKRLAEGATNLSAQSEALMAAVAVEVSKIRDEIKVSAEDNGIQIWNDLHDELMKLRAELETRWTDVSMPNAVTASRI